MESLEDGARVQRSRRRDVARRARLDRVTRVLCDAAEYMFARVHDDGHWCAELRSNPTVTAEYVLMRQALGLDLQPDRAALSRWLVGEQNADGSWGVARCYPGDVSTSVEVYLALKLLGTSPSDPLMKRAQSYIVGAGGVAGVRVFTRIFLAMFGLFPWRAVPHMPAELVLFPPVSPVNIYKLACWARGTIVPLLVILHHQPVHRLPNGTSENNDYLDELWLEPSNKDIPYAPSLRQVAVERGLGWALAFTLADKLVGALGGLRRSPLRRRALQKCVDWILQRQEPSGDWAGIFPPMLNNLLALPLAGFPVHSDPMQRGLQAMERFAWRDENGMRIQACVSPVWDTVLGLIGLCDAGMQQSDSRLRAAAEWIKNRQLLGPEGDWRIYRPELPPGGWAFEYDNCWYPDVDDTAAVILALVKQDPAVVGSSTISRAVHWILGMQNRDGGWGAFDVDNDKLYLNDIPFADMGALCDPSTPDVTGRIVEAFGLLTQRQHRGQLDPWLVSRMRTAVDRAVRFLTDTQEGSGAWWGRWGVNYVYGTSNVLCGLAYVREPRVATMCQRACDWIRAVQNQDGGWGEGLDTYLDADLAGHGVSTASQTSWAVMALLAHASPTDRAVVGGVDWLLAAQTESHDRGATWPEPQTTATGFPGHFYVRYDMYRHYFPLMALGRYARACGLQTLRNVRPQARRSGM